MMAARCGKATEPLVNSSLIEDRLRRMTPEQLRAAVAAYLPAEADSAERIRLIETALHSPAGPQLREAMARWIVHDIVPVEALVPETYAAWRAPVRDAMMFVVTHLSARRLAPKLLEQLELPPKSTPEARLLRLIAKVPGLQKLGQVIARNRHLGPALRNALAKLENGIRDVRPEDMAELIRRELGARLTEFEVQIRPGILSEASVSAVVRFTWRDPATGKLERGVFKVLKPHIPECFAEDMEFLHDLAQWFGTRHREYGFPRHVIPDTFNKVRRLLQHEVDFPREQKTLLGAWKQYESMPGVRVPRLIPPLCTSTITALTEEFGAKVTNAAAHLPDWRRRRIAEQLVEALVAAPLFAADEQTVFHADPHAGNLLYNSESGELIIVDWALRERLTHRQRRHLALLFLTMTLRDPVGAGNAVRELSQHPIRSRSPQAEMIRRSVAGYLEEMPATRLPGGADIMRLLEQLAVQGIRFPAPLIMLSKVLFTLDGIVADIGGSTGGTGFAIARHLAQRWLANPAAFRSPFRTMDWLTLQCSALLYGSRMWVRCEQALLDRLLPDRACATAAPA
jgi:predicted unusual protein kinase regulating ubiquinone biosynthesis (AarF/ABC1/UbiB family)